MKRMIKTAASAVLFAFLLFGCDQLQDSLSAEQEEDLLEDTGIASVYGNSWYYNGISTTDMSGSTNAYLKIDFGKKVRLETLSGRFTVSYTDSTTQMKATAEKALNGGFFASDYKSYNLDMTPVTAFLDGATVTNGTLTVTVSVSGFVCDEGDQKGRSVGAYSKNISVKPLYSSLSGLIFTTKSAPAGTQFSIPVESEISLENTASITVGEKPSSFKLDGVSSDGKSILFSTTEDLTGEIFNSDIEISGIRPTTSGTPYTQSFSASFMPGVVSKENSGFSDSDSSVDFAKINQLIVYDDGSENLKISLVFDTNTSSNKWWSGYSIHLLIDNESVEHSGMQNTSAWWQSAVSNAAGLASYVTIENGSIEAEVNSIFGDGTVTTVMNSCESADDTGTWNEEFNGTDIAVTGNNTDGMTLDSKTVTYTIPFSKIGGLKSGDNVRVFAKVGQIKWVEDNMPYSVGTLEQIPQSVNSSVTKAEWAGSYTSYTFDMSKALEYTIE